VQRITAEAGFHASQRGVEFGHVPALLDSGQVRPDHLGIGLEVDDRARAGQRLWALGPLTKGRYWEMIAVPDIREQAAAIADDIEVELQ